MNYARLTCKTMSKSRYKYPQGELAVIGIPCANEIFVGDASYGRKMLARIVCTRYDILFVDDLDLLVEKVKTQEITTEQILHWMDTSPSVIHAN